MASQARKRFDKNCEDIDRLLEIHRDLGGTGPGRRTRLEVLNKSAIVLLCAFWEAYCEDIAAEGLTHLVSHAATHDALPLELQKAIAKELERDEHDLAVWQLAGEGWREVLTGRLARLQEERNRRLNTPKTEQIDELFRTAVGIPKMSSYWKWDRLPASGARERLDEFVSLRGAIAHRGQASRSVRKVQVEDALKLVRRLVSKTGGRVNIVATNATGKRLW